MVISCFNGGGGLFFSFSDGGRASFLSEGGVPNGGASVLVWGVSKKIVRWRGCPHSTMGNPDTRR